MIHQYKVELQASIKMKRQRENNHFLRENVRENNKKFIENNMRRKKSKNKKYCNKHKIIQVMLCYIIK